MIIIRTYKIPRHDEHKIGADLIIFICIISPASSRNVKIIPAQVKITGCEIKQGFPHIRSDTVFLPTGRGRRIGISNKKKLIEQLETMKKGFWKVLFNFINK